jgi:hypothetical protein
VSDVIETRDLWKSGELVISAEMIADDTRPEDLMPDFDNPADEAEFRRHLESGDLEYVGMVVTVTYAGAEIGSDSLWGIESGLVGHVGTGGYVGPGNPGDPIIADAWEITPADYGPELYEGRSVVQMGSPLSGVIAGAIWNARKWAGEHGNDEMRAALVAAEAWADPNAHKRVGA